MSKPRVFCSGRSWGIGALLGLVTVEPSSAPTFPRCPVAMPVFLLSSERADGWVLSSVFNSFTFDWLTRQRLGGTNLSYSLIADIPLLTPEELSVLASTTARLAWPHVQFAESWLSINRFGRWKGLWALTRAERLRLR